LKFRYEFMTLTQLGELFGESNQKVGKWLGKIGLRTEANKPSREAFEGGYVEAKPSRNQGYYYVWRSDKTVAALTAAGHKPAVHPACELLAPCQLNGPFEVRTNPTFGFEVVNGDGTVAVWIRGGQNAKFVCDLLNVADRNGVVRRLLNKPVEPEQCEEQVRKPVVPPARVNDAASAAVACPRAANRPADFQFL
jgi:hypothetical protein